MATKSILTTYGNNRILDAIAQGTSVPITAIVYGDANGSQYEPTLDQTSLVHQLGSLTTISKEFDEEEGFLYFKAAIPANADAFTLREFGILDDQNKLLTVTVVPDIEKPAAEDGVSIALPITIGFKTSTGEIMVIVEDGTDVYANTDLSNLTSVGEHHFDTTYANTDLSNLTLEGEQHFLGKTRITNCIKEMPQRIDYSLDSGTLTIKAGSTIIIPYGIQDLSSTYTEGSIFLNNNFIVDSTQFSSNKFFVWATIQSDLTTTWTYGEYGLSIFVDIENNRLLIYDRATDASGSAAPSSTCTFYNVTSNKVSRYSAGTETQSNLSFPIARVTSSETQIATVDELFNGISHMGNTFIVDKDVSLYVPNERNSNGSLKNIEHAFNNLKISTNTFDLNKDYTYFYDYTNDSFVCWLSSSYYLESPNDSLIENRVYYNYDTNSYTQYISSSKTTNIYCELGTFYGKTTYMSNFKAKYAFRAIDYTNFLEIKYDLTNLQRDIATAQSTANTALSNAATAQSTANRALSNAATAQSTANRAVYTTGSQTVAGNKTFMGATTLKKTTIQDTLSVSGGATFSKAVSTTNTFTNSGGATFSSTLESTGAFSNSGGATFTGTTKVPASKTAGTALQLASRGSNYIKFGDGTILQWGAGTTSNHYIYVNLPIKYSSDSSYRAILTDGGGDTDTSVQKVIAYAANRFRVYSNTSDNDNFQWFTIGR